MTVLQAPTAVVPDRHFRTDHLMADLKGRSVRGGAVTLSAQAVKLVLQLGSTAALARLLTPADFGLVAMVSAFTGFVSLFKDLGLSMATVQRAEISHEQVSTLFWINVALSIGLMGCSAALAPVVAWFYGEPRLVWITLAIAGTFIFGGLTVQHQALLRRQMQFERLAIIEIIAMAVGVGVAVTVGWHTRSYWALICMPAGMAVANAIGVWFACGWIPGLPKRDTGVMPMLSFGGQITGSSLVRYAAQNIDYILLGFVWGSSPLGLYRKSYELMMLPVRQLNTPMAAVMFPSLSRLQFDTESFRRSYTLALQALAISGMPLMAFLVIDADLVIPFLLGHQWTDAVDLFRLLAIAALAATIQVAPDFLFLAYGQGSRLLRASLYDLLVTAVALLIGIPYGAAGVAIAVGISATLSLMARTLYATHGSPLRPCEIVWALVPGISISCVVGSSILGLRVLREGSGPAWLFLDCVTAALTWSALIIFTPVGGAIARMIRSLLNARPRTQDR